MGVLFLQAIDTDNRSKNERIKRHIPEDVAMNTDGIQSMKVIAFLLFCFVPHHRKLDF